MLVGADVGPGLLDHLKAWPGVLLPFAGAAETAGLCVSSLREAGVASSVPGELLRWSLQEMSALARGE